MPYISGLIHFLITLPARIIRKEAAEVYKGLLLVARGAILLL
jgi:hypothetical protein